MFMVGGGVTVIICKRLFESPQSKQPLHVLTYSGEEKREKNACCPEFYFVYRYLGALRI